MTTHEDFEAILPLVSTPAEVHDPGGLSRRRFLQGAVAAAAAAAVLPAIRPGSARAAGLAAHEGVVVNVFLGGGNDGLNTVVPMAGDLRAQYERLRPGVLVPAQQLRALSPEWGLHPSLSALHARFTSGRVAIVQGAGLAGSDLSHLTATQQAMAGSTQFDGTGWLGRYLDELPDSHQAMRAVAIGTSVPMTLIGRRARVTALSPDVPLWGIDRTATGSGELIDTVASMADAPTGLGPWADAIAAAGRTAINEAKLLSGVMADAAAVGGPMAQRLSLAAHVINADLGVRTIGVVLGGGWDTHIAQLHQHGLLLEQLDAALEQFFATLAPERRSQVVVMVQSEFGRRPESNGGLGTDHGTANPMIVVGENVAGGLHGEPASLETFDDRGNLVPTIDFRAVYHGLIGEWLAGQPSDTLSRSYDGLNLFAAGPGQSRP